MSLQAAQIMGSFWTPSQEELGTMKTRRKWTELVARAEFRAPSVYPRWSSKNAQSGSEILLKDV
jgi:hypothetical protein